MIEQSANEASDLTRQLLGLARPEAHRREPIRIEEIVERVVKIVCRTFDRRIQVETRLSVGLPGVEGDPVQIEQALLNLCLNARDAMPEGGTLTVETTLVTLGPEHPARPLQCPPGDYVQIGVQDTGRGMEPEVMRRIFEPFFTTKPSGQGSGLGLAMVYAIAHRHGGFARAQSEVGRGSRFVIHLPAATLPSRTPSAQAPARLEQGSGTVLVVDDEPKVLAFAQKGLEKLGYCVLTAESGRQACAIFASRSQTIEFVLLDMIMPEMSGLETYQKLRDIDPEVRIIASSGYGAASIGLEAPERRLMDFLQKPYTLERLSQALKKAQRS